MATGDHEILRKSGLGHLVPEGGKKYYTVFYTCDSTIKDCNHLLQRICSDTDEIDGLLRLVPDKGKILEEFSRSDETSGGLDLKVAQWGAKGSNSAKYVNPIDVDIIQTFRNYINSILEIQNRSFEARDGIVILIDEFDVIQNKEHVGSIIKALTSDKIKFAISGIGEDLTALVDDHGSIERLVEQGYAHVLPMDRQEIESIFQIARALFDEKLSFSDNVVEEIWKLSEGYPYFAQLIGKSCVEKRNALGIADVDDEILNLVIDDIRKGVAFPTLERRYQRAVGESEGRKIILTLLAEQSYELTDVDGEVSLKEIRAVAQELDVEHIDQLVPRLADKKFGPAIVKRDRGRYEFADPVLRAYVKIRR